MTPFSSEPVVRSRRWWQTPRTRLVALLGGATLAITILAATQAGDSLSYYSTPEELSQHLEQRTDTSGARWRVGGRVDGETIVWQDGRPTSFEIFGEGGERMLISYDGIVPNLFGPYAFVVVEGEVIDAEQRHLRADSVIIKHENEFFSDEPPADSPSSNFVRPRTPDDEAAGGGQR